MSLTLSDFIEVMEPGWHTVVLASAPDEDEEILDDEAVNIDKSDLPSDDEEALDDSDVTLGDEEEEEDPEE